MREKYLLIVIIFIACLTRFFFLSEFPKGFSGDEAQQGYSAYSILKTGKDEWGQFLPVNPRGFGDFKPPLYTYITVPSVAIFGLNEYAVRFPAAVVGVLTIIVVYFLAYELFKNYQIALWSSFLLSISPWHIQISRTAFEGGVGVLLFSAGLFFFLKGLTNRVNLIFSSILLALGLYTYHSFKVFIILYIIGLFFIYKNKIKTKQIILPVIIFLIFLIPIILNLRANLVRSLDVGINSKQQIQGYFENKGTSPLPPVLDEVFDNKFIFFSRTFFENYLSYYSPYFLFTGLRPDNSYLNFPKFSLLYFIEILFWIFAIYHLITRRFDNLKLLILWLLLAPIPASLATGSMSAHRAVTILPLTSIISAIGIISLKEFITQHYKLIKSKINLYLVTLLIISFTQFLYFYIITLPKNTPQSLRSEYKQVFTEAIELSSKYDQVVFSRVFSQPQIFIAFYGKVDPADFQIAAHNWLRYEKSDKLYIDQLESWNLGKFYFEDLNWQQKESKRKNALIISKPEDFPQDIPTIYEVKDKDKILYKFVSVK